MAEEKTPKSYRILHTQVGPYRQGDIVSANDLRDTQGNQWDLKRLKALGAIEVVKQPRTTEAPTAGPEAPGPIPEPEEEPPATTPTKTGTRAVSSAGNPPVTTRTK